MSGRQFKASVYRGLKTATKRVLDSCGPLKTAVSLSRIKSDTTLQRFGSNAVDNADRFMSIDVALDLMAASGDIEILSAMAYELDHAVIERVQPGGDVALTAFVQMANSGRVIADLSNSLIDGRITQEEIRELDLIADIDAVLKGARKLKSQLQKIDKAGR